VVVRVDDRNHYGVAIEPDGVQALLSRVLGRPLGLTRQELDLGTVLSGAAAALVVQVARVLTGAPVVLASPPSQDAFELEASILVERQAFAVAVRAWIDLPVADERPDPERLRMLDVELPLIVGLALAGRSDLAMLGVGDAWFPGEGLWIDRSLAGRGALAAPGSERGVWVDLAPGGSVVLRGGDAELRADAEPAAAADAMADSSPQASLESLVAEAPVVVRVELGTVSLNAGEVTALRPGDVIETGQRLGQPVVLRVAGRAIARGDLVEVEGELGVRIRELLGQEP
jgi:flagellar motor switch/type III secretory pathway protein FliN